jgi:drug/metabolite transporter (DMT)-like permease
MPAAAEPTVPTSLSAGSRPTSQVPGLVVLSFAAVYILWGSTYLAMRVGIESFPPLLLAGTRHLAVGLLLFPLLRWRTRIKPTAEHWKTAAITGCLLLFLGNGSVCWAEQTVPSGVAALLVATVCLWMVLVDWLRPRGHRPSSRVLAGVVLGFAGLLFLVGPSSLIGTGRIDPLGASVLVLASFAWACGSLYSKHGSLPASPMLGMAMQSLCGGIALWIAGFLTGEVHRLHFSAVSARSWTAVVYLAIFGSALGFTAYIYILKKSTAARVGTYALVNPVVALLLGWLFAGEAFTLRTFLSALVILTAVLLVIMAPHRDPAHDVDAVPAPGEA